MLRLSLPALDIHTSAERPTLPSLASLCLPDIHSRRPRMHAHAHATQSSDSKTSNANNANDLLRISSVSSESSDSSESSEFSATSSCTTASSSSSSGSTLHVRSPKVLKLVKRHHPYFNPTRHRIVLADRFDGADLILALPLKPEAIAADPSLTRHFAFAKGRGLNLDQPQFLFGTSAKYLHYEQVRREFPASLHPYRITPRNPGDPLPTLAQPTAASTLTPPPTPSAKPRTL
ncbi:uncharacterized protein TRAVEDRAFT_22993 [Trametes versicolor FP-101664 SS1]|uniref:uncharacterized protein n=1 Tax=Trametes versicolor (strain FP-101664) TaxID=717944 RepID=UPI000462460E|nr:uncharacterized protein TRAVEDRAFT_22993 [Trametes versicolor FP-101664 SS1]EIW55255.1 hypothetical protein TRAVEDRAFT_22993 [Trametes versicolor FP-101664 SS1]